jgi:hypothetical protein
MTCASMTQRGDFVSGSKRRIKPVARGIPFVLFAAVNSWALPFLQDGGLLLVGLWACDFLVPILLRTDKWQGVLIVALGLCAFVGVSACAWRGAGWGRGEWGALMHAPASAVLRCLTPGASAALIGRGVAAGAPSGGR